MLIYTNSGCSSLSFSASGYKSVSNRKRNGIRAKTLKRGAHQSHPRQSKAKKNNTKKKPRKLKKLNANNAKFLKKLGLRLKKQ